MKGLIILFLLTIPLTSSACVINMYSKIITTTKNTDISIKDLILSSTCSQKTNTTLVNIINNFENSISTKYILEAFSNEFNEEISYISPSIITKISLPKLLVNNINTSSKAKFAEVSILSGKRILSLRNSERLKISCTNCSSGGPKEIQAFIQNVRDGTEKRFWIRGNLLIQANILTTTQNISVTKKRLTKSDVQVVEKYVEHPEIYFTNVDHIMFYKMSRTLAKGDALKTRELIPISLVRPGQAVQVIFKHGNLLLKSLAMPTSIGKLGESVTLRHIKTLKTIYGTVIGNNKVQAAL